MPMTSWLKEKNKLVIRHVFSWILISVIIDCLDPSCYNCAWYKEIWETFLIMIEYAFVYYFGFFFLAPKLFPRFIWTFVVYLLIAVIAVVFYQYWSNHIRGDLLPEFTADHLYDYYSHFTSVFILDSTTATLSYGFYKNKISQQVMKEQYEKEQISLIRELGFYKNQFNPHITFNFLNYCYRYVHEDSKETAEAIELFSEMMRFTLENKPDERIPLAMEMEYIDKYIRLKKILSPRVNALLKMEGNTQKKKILPRLLITFVENAFKHGETFSAENPIRINLSCTDKKLIFEVINRKKAQKTLVSTGIGQDNARNQLELFYKNKYELHIQEDKENYSCWLKLDI